MTEQATATSTPAAAPAAAEAAPQSALAAGAKSESVESMLASAAKAAAQAPEAHDYGKLKVDGVGEPVMKAAVELFAKHKIAPDAAQEVLAGLAKAQGEFRTQSEKQQIAEVDAAWQKELRDDKDFGGANYDRNTKLVEAAVNGLLTKEQAQAAKDSGLLGNPLFARTVLAAERIVAKATKQDSTAVSGSQGGAGSESEQWARANAKTVAGLKAIGIKV